jgi:adenylate cyclase
MSHMRLDRAEDARAVAQEFVGIAPSYRIIPNAPVLGQFCAELRQAGLPE